MKRISTYPDREIPLPTEAELEVLGVIWEQGRGTVGSVHFVLNERRARGYTTVLKLMQIMLARGCCRGSIRSGRISTCPW